MPPSGQHAEEAEARAHLPATAAGLTHVLAADSDELVAGGLERHPLEQMAFALVVLTSACELCAGCCQPLSELVTRRLQVFEREHDRPGGRGPRDGHERCGEGGCGDRRELPIQPGELVTQAAPGGGLVDFDAGERIAGGGRKGTSDEFRRGRDGTLEDFHGHPPMGARGLAPQKSCVPSMPIR